MYCFTTRRRIPTPYPGTAFFSAYVILITFLLGAILPRTAGAQSNLVEASVDHQAPRPEALHDGRTNEKTWLREQLFRQLEQAQSGAQDPNDSPARSGRMQSLVQAVAGSFDESKLTPSDGADGDRFGVLVAASGDRVVVGAPAPGVVNLAGELNPIIINPDRETQWDSERPGSVYVFDYDGTSWSETKLTASGGDLNDGFGASVAVSGDWVVVGAPTDNYNAGAAYIYHDDDGSWSETKLTASDGVSRGRDCDTNTSCLAKTGDLFGASVAVNDYGPTQMVLVGAPTADFKGYDDTTFIEWVRNVGLVYQYVNHGEGWRKSGSISAFRGSRDYCDAVGGDSAYDPCHEHEGEEFGFSIAMSGSGQWVVGAPGPVLWSSWLPQEVSLSGSAYVRNLRNGGGLGKLTASDGGDGDQFGRSVAASGDRVVVGDRAGPGPRGLMGSVYVYDHDEAGWSETKLTEYGKSLAASEDRVVVGMPPFGDLAGAHVYDFDGSGWSETKLTASDGALVGVSVAASNDRIFSGAYGTGSVYVFSPETNQPPVADAGPDQTIEATGPDGAAVALDGTDSSDPDGDPLTFTWTDASDDDVATGENPSVTLGLGTHILTLEVEDPSGATASDEVTIVVEDTTPPEIDVAASPMVLWPPNHKYHTITVGDFVTGVRDLVDVSIDLSAVAITSVSSDEPEEAGGAGNDRGSKGRNGGGDETAEDIVVQTCQAVDVRAERLGSGNGRVYIITVAASDASNNTGTADFEVHVPHDRNTPALADPGSGFTVTSNLDCPDVPPGNIEGAFKASTEPAERPSDYSLSQNFPNPFNPETVISFSLPEASHVRIVVYDAMGREVALLADGSRPAGLHEVRWRADNLPSGLYLYRITAGPFNKVRRMMLIK